MNNSDLMTITEFAKYTGVNQSTLRFYEKIGLLSPSERGGDNNYRYYSPLQSMTLSYITVLSDLGVKLDSIKDMIKDRTPESIIELLSRQEVELDSQLNKLRTAYSIIHTLRKNIQTGLVAAPEGHVRIEELDDVHFILGPVNEFKDNETFHKAFVNFNDSAKEYRINLRYPVGGYHYDIDSFLAAPARPDKFFSLDPLGNCTRGAGKYLVGYKRGYFGEFGDIPQKMAAYAEEHNLVFNGPVYTLYLFDEVCMPNPEQYLARLSVSVSKRRITARERIGTANAENCPVLKSCNRPHCVD
jgi:DNA-binding transcriptional MerR regulator/effector-binding domain-containing protein